MTSRRGEVFIISNFYAARDNLVQTLLLLGSTALGSVGTTRFALLERRNARNIRVRAGLGKRRGQQLLSAVVTAFAARLQAPRW